MYLQLYDSTKIAKGHTKSIIWDTQNGFLQGIPNSFYNFLSNKYENYQILKNKLEADDKETLDEYIDFIIENNLGFSVKTIEELENFTRSTVYHEMPSNVDYIIVDINSNRVFNSLLIEKIREINVKYVQIRISEKVPVKEIENVLKSLRLFNSSDIHEMMVVMPYHNELYFSIVNRNFMIDSDKYLSMVFYGAEKDSFQDFGSVILNTITKMLYLPISCGFIDFRNFNPNQNFFLESLHHNSCLHKKISIDAEGNIRNCPSMPQSFGNIKDTNLEEALNHLDFKKYWNLTKDHIEVCKDCEFRYICTDCRAYTERTHENSEGLDISKPLKCGYDPYTGEWAEWSTNPLKEKAIKFYGMEDLVKK